MSGQPVHLSGFGNEFASEAIAGAPPVGQNAPRRHPPGLYAEQMSGTPFTVARREAGRTWLYRIRPSAAQPPYRRIDNGVLCAPPAEPTPNRLRWDPSPIAHEPADFVAGLITMTTTADTPSGTGVPVHIDRANRSIQRVFRTTDGLANPRDFPAPSAWFEQRDQPVQPVQTFMGALWATERDHSPFDVVAWHGNLGPYKYDLARFMTINTVGFDHPDPSIFTVVTSSTDAAGVANMDRVIFPPRRMAAEHTFRPPWFHRNVMNACMGLALGVYDAVVGGLLPGGLSLHICMSAHGPDAATVGRAMAPQRIDDTPACMFATRQALRPPRLAPELPELQGDHDACRQGPRVRCTGPGRCPMQDGRTRPWYRGSALPIRTVRHGG